MRRFPWSTVAAPPRYFAKEKAGRGSGASCRQTLGTAFCIGGGNGGKHKGQRIVWRCPLVFSQLLRQTFQKQKVPQHIAKPSGHQSGSPIKPSQARKMKLPPKQVRNSRSPRVVVRPSTPLRSAPPGCLISSTISRPIVENRQMKIAAVGQVHAIQLSISNSPHREALRDVVADKIDHDGAGDDGERAGGGKQAQFISRRRRGFGHRGSDGLGGHSCQGLGQQQLHP
mmetsp:Transcript_23115/g.39433  ORF Transcript_23115/g.39433 Transcript_23115/m.39433 type:complete len:227 (+) Transcript_23115:1673-2353(+)